MKTALRGDQQKVILKKSHPTISVLNNTSKQIYIAVSLVTTHTPLCSWADNFCKKTLLKLQLTIIKAIKSANGWWPYIETAHSKVECSPKPLHYKQLWHPRRGLQEVKTDCSKTNVTSLNSTSRLFTGTTDQCYKYFRFAVLSLSCVCRYQEALQE